MIRQVMKFRMNSSMIFSQLKTIQFLWTFRTIGCFAFFERSTKTRSIWNRILRFFYLILSKNKKLKFPFAVRRFICSDFSALELYLSQTTSRFATLILKQARPHCCSLSKKQLWFYAAIISLLPLWTKPILWTFLTFIKTASWQTTTNWTKFRTVKSTRVANLFLKWTIRIFL
jgi:hypothetical protein